MKSWRFLGLSLVFVSSIASGQDNYRISLTPADASFYCGIVNECRFVIEDASDPPRVFKFQASSNGAQLNYDEGGRLSVLPKSRKFSIRVYGTINKKIFYVGKIDSRCIDPPVGDAAFQSNFPHPQKNLKKTKKFSVQGEMVEEDANLTIDFSAGMVDQLKEGQESLVALRVSRPLNGVNIAIPWRECEIRSADAEIRQDEKQVVGITPKPGMKSCLFEIFHLGDKIGEQQIRVTGR